MTKPDRKRSILDAALTCFLDLGYTGTSIADIRNASGASTGSIYHFFPSKEAIATSLFFEAVDGWAEATRKAQTSDSAEGVIRGSLEGLVNWGLARPDQFRLMDELRFLEPLIRHSPDLSDAMRAGADAARQIYEAQAARGKVRKLPWPIAHAFILGPAYDYLRSYAAGRARVPKSRALKLLSDAAWEAVRQ